jgi:hypothetical protein
MDGDGAHHNGGDRLRRAVARVERGAAVLGRRAGGDGVLRRGDGGAVLPHRRLATFSTTRSAASCGTGRTWRPRGSSSVSDFPLRPCPLHFSSD